MIVSTTPTIQGREVSSYKGLVTGEAIIGAHIFKDLFAGIRDIVGGRAGAYEKTIREARDAAIGEMEADAKRVGGNAVIGVDLDYAVVGQGGSMMMVTVSGTAVVLS